MTFTCSLCGCEVERAHCAAHRCSAAACAGEGCRIVCFRCLLQKGEKVLAERRTVSVESSGVVV